MSKEQAVLFQDFSIDEAIAIAKRVSTRADKVCVSSGHVTLYRRAIDDVIRELQRAERRRP